MPLSAASWRRPRASFIYLVHPEGNWIEVGGRNPYFMIGETPYGKLILDRTLDYKTTLTNTLRLAYLSFGSTCARASDVGFPINILTFNNEDQKWRDAHYIDDDVRAQRYWWSDNLTQLAREIPDGPWVEDLLHAPLWDVDNKSDAG